MYYGEDALSSCYVWDIDTGFAAAILIKKTCTVDQKGCWDSINVMEVCFTFNHNLLARMTCWYDTSVHMCREYLEAFALYFAILNLNAFLDVKELSESEMHLMLLIKTLQYQLTQS